MKNYNYSIYKGIEVEITQNPNGDFMLIFRGANPPDTTFFLAQGCKDVYNKIILRGEVTNAFSVSTYALYKNFKFQVDRFENGKYRLSTSDTKIYVALNLHFVDRGWYDIWVDKNEIQKMWEERKPSGYGFPFPEGMKKVEEIEI